MSKEKICISIGDKALTRQGVGIITKIDTSTFSIPLVTVKLVQGKYKGEEIVTTNYELSSHGNGARRKNENR